MTDIDIIKLTLDVTALFTIEYPDTLNDLLRNKNKNKDDNNQFNPLN